MSIDYTPNLDSINGAISHLGVTVHKLYANTKASDYYVEVTFIQDDGYTWRTVVPYIYRRSNLNLGSDKAVAEYLLGLKRYFTKRSMDDWREREWNKWLIERNAARYPEKLVTIDFFKILLSFKTEVDFPNNPNPQRRFQDIKERGYTVSVYPLGDKLWGKVLLPIPLYDEMGYETFTPQFKSRVIRLFKGVNAYEAKPTAKGSLIPDHKFSEVRWDKDTKTDNPMDMTDEEIIAKFQLLDNQRNQQKREICRNCVQTGMRGKLFGIDYYPQGTERWNDDIPKVGKAAEQGCVGCPWYDIEAWRRAVNEKLNK